MHSSRRASLAAGARDTVPMLVGAAPFGVIFGTLVAAGPLALWQGVKDGRIKKGQLLLMEAMGGGLTWGACVLRL